MDSVETRQLREPRNRVSTRAVSYWTVRAMSGWVGVFVLVGAIVYFIVGLRGAGLLAVAAGGLLMAGVHVLVMPQWRYRVHRWENTAGAVFTQSGWFVQERRLAPLSRVQTVDSVRGPFEQLFGLANVTVTTASAAGPVKIHALDRSVAEDLVEQLTLAAQTGPDDAT